MNVDLLDDFFSTPPVQPNDIQNKDTDYFTEQFWGEKNQGFDVLYQNMKHGQVSVKSLQDFIRESAASEELHAKHLTKLAKQAANVSPFGTFAPMFELCRGMSEKLSSCHMDIVHKLQDVTKDLAKYLEEQKAKHKQVKDEVNATAVTLQQLQNTSGLVLKSKEKYHQLCAEAERLKRNGVGLPKEIEKIESKTKKASEDYRNVVDKYENVRKEYEQKMTESAKKFQEVEIAHLKQMRNILETYILSFENANVLVGQVHQEFRRQISENTINLLLRKFSESKGTGVDRPGPLTFEEYDTSATLSVIEGQSDAVTSGDTTPPPTTHSSRRTINLPFRRRKPRKQTKESGSGSKEPEKETDSIESPDKDGIVKVDDEGYSIRPEIPKETNNSWNNSSSSSDSESDDFPMKKIQVKINPVEKSNTSTTNGGNLDALNAITKNLTLTSSNVLGVGKKTNLRKKKAETRSSSRSQLSELLAEEARGRQGVVTRGAESFVAPGATGKSSSEFFLRGQAEDGEKCVARHSDDSLAATRANGEAAKDGFSSDPIVGEPEHKATAESMFLASRPPLKYPFVKSASKNPFLCDGSCRKKKLLNWTRFDESSSRDDQVTCFDTLKFFASRQSRMTSSETTAAIEQNGSTLTKTKSTNDEILNLFSKPTSVSSSVPNGSDIPPGVRSNSADVFGQSFSDHSASNPSIAQSSSMNNLFVLSSNKDNIKEDAEEKSQSEFSSPGSYSNVETERPATLQLNGKNGSGIAKDSSAPVTSPESWSSLSSPVDNYTPSRGPSPLTLMQGESVPVAVAFTETVNAFFKGVNGEQCLLKIVGNVQMSFPSGIVRTFVSNPDPPVLSFVIKETNNLQDVAPSLGFITPDPMLTNSSQRAFKFNTTLLSSHIKKMVEANPTAPYYNIPLLAYQFNSPSGHNVAPLHLSALWDCDVSNTNISINYKFNNAAGASSLNNVHVIVPVSGGVTGQQSDPSASWNTAQNRLLWKLGSPISSTTPSRTLNACLSLSSGPSSVVPFAVQFMGEGSTLTGSDFELYGSGYRLSLKKKRFVTGKYLCTPH